MPNPSLLSQILAADPRKLVRFPEYPVDTALAELRNLQDHVEQARKQAETPRASPSAAEPAAVEQASGMTEAFAHSLAALATQVWRTRGKLMDATTGEPKEETRRAYRHIEAAFEAFAQMGVTMNDWVNQPYDPGLPVKVLTFQPTAGVVRDTVVEAVKPTVVWKDRLLQLGEVVVGIPPNTEKPQ